jgi:alpha-D-ribose 1-methylphosphonate 5-triphosphate synthase subunit PhnH
MVRETVFDDVFDSQATFRALLDCLSRPGAVRTLPARSFGSTPAEFCPPALSLLKTLCDHRVSFSVGSSALRADWVSYLEINLSARFRSVGEADYVLFDGKKFDADFALLKRGSLEFPESSATAVLCVQQLSDKQPPGPSTCQLRLRGPGVRDLATLAVAGFDLQYLHERSQANRFYPMGIDLFFLDWDRRLAGIPRTSVVEAA